MPLEIHDFLGLCAIGSIVGIAMRVDMEKVRKNDLVRMLVGMLDVEAIPPSVEIVVGESVYDIFFKIEDTVVGAIDVEVNHDDDPEEDDNSDKGKDVEMEDRESKRPKNNLDNNAQVPGSSKGQSSSCFKGNALGLLASVPSGLRRGRL